MFNWNMFPHTDITRINLDWIMDCLRALKGGLTHQILSKKSDNPFDFEWIDNTGASSYNSLSDLPKINNVELRGNKTTSDLGIVIPEAATSEPVDLGPVAKIGTSLRYARANHVHKKPSPADIGAVAKGDLHYVTPEMFGAVGDGVEDDTAAIIAAISAGDVVVFKPNAVYAVTAVATPNLSNTILYGNGATLKSTVTQGNYQIVGVLSNLVDLSGSETGFVNGFIEIHDLVIDGNATVFTSTDTSNYLNGIALRNFSTVVIDGCTVKNTLNAGAKLIMCDKSVVTNCRFKDICLYTYTRTSFVGEAVVSAGYFYVNGGGIRIYSPVSSLVVDSCIFDNVYDSPAVAKNCAYQCISHCVMNTVHRRAFEANVVTDGIDRMDILSVFEDNLIDGLNGPFVSIQGDMQSNVHARYVIRNNTVTNIRGVSDPVTPLSDVSGSTVIVYNTGANLADVELEFTNNNIEYAETPMFSPSISNHMNISGVKKASIVGNTFTNVIDSTGNPFVYVSHGDTEIDFSGNILNGEYAPEQIIYGSMNRLQLNGNVFNFNSAPSGSTAYKGCVCLLMAAQYSNFGIVTISNNNVPVAGWTRLCRIRNYPESMFIRNNYVPTGSIISTYFASGAKEYPDNLIVTENIASSFGGSSTDVTVYINVNNSFNA